MNAHPVTSPSLVLSLVNDPAGDRTQDLRIKSTSLPLVAERQARNGSVPLDTVLPLVRSSSGGGARSLPRHLKLKHCWTCGYGFRGPGRTCAKCPALRHPYPPRAAIQRTVRKAGMFERVSP